MAKPFKLGAVTKVVDPQELYQVITQASSQNPAEVHASSKRVEELLDYFGTFDGLHEIAATRSVPLPVRKQSIIQFKNKALNHWRSRKCVLCSIHDLVFADIKQAFIRRATSQDPVTMHDLF
jgi:hypothetical protein